MNASKLAAAGDGDGRPRLLVVDDDPELGAMLETFLAGEGFATARAGGGAEAFRLIAERRFDLVILDIMMPGPDGFEILRRLRRQGAIPVLMLTARGRDEDRILGLELGADDYLAKPFNPRELAARVRAILRRLDRDGAGARPPLRIGPLELEPARLRVRLGGAEIRLTAAEFLVLEALARAAGRVQSRAALTEHALGRPLEAYDRSIDTHVANLRRKLGLGAGLDVEIRGVRGAGYVLTAGASGR